MGAKTLKLKVRNYSNFTITKQVLAWSHLIILHVLSHSFFFNIIRIEAAIPIIKEGLKTTDKGWLKAAPGEQHS